MNRLFKFFGALLLLTNLPTYAHEVRPAYLELRETQTSEFNVLWKTPMRGEMRLALTPVFSAKTKEMTPVATRHTGSAEVQTWRMKAVEPLRGSTLRIDGLRTTMTDTLVRMEFIDGTDWVKRLTPSEMATEVPMQADGWSVSGEYFGLGAEHILFGIDHLLFVLALILIVIGWKKLVATITAFTVAHSITLAGATLGLVNMPAAPVEAIIALSIVFVAAEIIRMHRGQEGITSSAPWIVAFTFGLLHGFGFAGALSEVGLPQGHIPLALLFFNLGVEAGQLLFVAAVISVMAVGRRIRMPIPYWLRLVPSYAIGSLAMFWVLQRVAAF